MPWKYLRMTRRCTCVTPDLEEEEINDMLQRFFSEPLRFYGKTPLPLAAGFPIPDFVFWDWDPDMQTDN
jgi:hypothetical protein